MSLGVNTIAKPIVSVTKLRQTSLKIRQMRYVKQRDCNSPVFSLELLAATASAEQEHHAEAVFALSEGWTSTGGCRCPRASRDGREQEASPTPWQKTAAPSQEPEPQQCPWAACIAPVSWTSFPAWKFSLESLPVLGRPRSNYTVPFVLPGS